MDITESEALAATVRAFVKRERRDRYLAFLPIKEKTEGTLLEMLHNRFGSELMQQHAANFSGSSEMLAERLKRLGAPEKCWTFSPCDYDGVLDLLTSATREVVDGGCGALIVCIPGKLAYYEDEFSTTKKILHRSAQGA
jgi:hypothetical protein